MAQTFYWTNNAADSGTIAACSSLAAAGTTDNQEVSNPAGSHSSPTMSVTTSSGSPAQRALHVESAAGEPGDAGWPAGTVTVRLNVTTGNSNVIIDSVEVCRVNSSGVSQGTYGSATALAITATSGIKTVNVTCSAMSGALSTDRFYIVVGIYRAGGAHGNQSITITGDQDIDTPFDVPAASVAPDSVASGEAVSDTAAIANLSNIGNGASEEGVGDVTITLPLLVQPDSVDSGESVSNAALSAELSPDSVTSGETVSDTTLGVETGPGSIGSGESVSDVTVSTGASVSPESVPSGEAFDDNSPSSVAPTVTPGSGEIGESVGDVTVDTSAHVTLESVPSGEVVGDPGLRTQLDLDDVPSGEVVGNVTVLTATTVQPGSVFSGEVVGDVDWDATVAPDSVGELVAVGVAVSEKTQQEQVDPRYRRTQSSASWQTSQRRFLLRYFSASTVDWLLGQKPNRRP